MIYYFDTSFVLSLFIADAHTERADRGMADLKEEAILSVLCALEFAASVSRAVRMGRMSVQVADEALADFDDWRTRSAVSLPMNDVDAERAASLVRDCTTKLAAVDVLHLAAAMKVGATLVTFDVRLAEAARARRVMVELG